MGVRALSEPRPAGLRAGGPAAAHGGRGTDRRLEAAPLARVDEALVVALTTVPALQPGDKFITVKQAIAEKGMDASLMPLHPRSNETLSGLAGQMLVSKGVAKGTPEVARLEGSARATAVNTYRRADIYLVLEEIIRSKPKALF